MKGRPTRSPALTGRIEQAGSRHQFHRLVRGKDEPTHLCRELVDASLRATILQTLRALNEDLGISFVYITHDLTTAYQVSDNILVLYRGRMAEVGDVESVIKRPQHPYTQLLVGSIPLPDPERRWGESVVSATIDESQSSLAGCLFAARCPHVMDRCRQEVPPLYRTDRHRADACFLAPLQANSDLPVVEGDVTGVFRPAERLLGPPGATEIVVVDPPLARASTH